MIHKALLLFFFIVGTGLLYRVPRLPHAHSTQVQMLTQVSVVIPARNEEHRIAPLLHSLQRQKIQPGEIIVVDDQSEDRTAEMAADAGFQVLRSAPLPDGWQGKSWACWQGAQVAQHPILCFLDADTVLEEDGLIRIYQEFSQDMTPLSIQPYHSIEKPYENLSAYFNLIVMMGTCSFSPWGDGIRAKAFFGPCQMMMRADYLDIGGHSKAKSSVLDDVALGHLLTNAGQSIRNRAGRDSINFRMYPHGINDVIQGWSKNFALGSQSIGFYPMVGIAGWVYASLSTFVGTTLWFMQPSLSVSTLFLPFYGLFVLQLWWMLKKIGNFSVLTAVLYPIPLMFFLMVFLRAYVLSFLVRKVTWKGRTLSTRKDG